MAVTDTDESCSDGRSAFDLMELARARVKEHGRSHGRQYDEAGFCVIEKLAYANAFVEAFLEENFVAVAVNDAECGRLAGLVAQAVGTERGAHVDEFVIHGDAAD